MGLGCIRWYSHWGWPKVVADLYTDVVAALGGWNGNGEAVTQMPDRPHHTETAIENCVRHALVKAMIARESARRDLIKARDMVNTILREYQDADASCLAIEEEAKRLGLDLSRLGETDAT